MIQINKNNRYLDEFTSEVVNFLEEELSRCIKYKKIVTPSYKNTDTEKNKKKNTIIEIEDKDILCLKKMKGYIKNLILADIEEQQRFIEALAIKYPDIFKKYEKNEPKANFYKAIKYIFIDRGYESKISSAKDGKIAYTLVKEIGLASCPYCNRNYISVLIKEEKGDSKTRPQLDHFYPKAIYPFLACSFYNLIPSCSACNLMKSAKDSYRKNVINPYELETDSFKFSYTLNNTDILNIGIQDSSKYDYKESINIIFDKEEPSNTEFFELEKLYNQEHRDVVIELLVKKAYYPQSYIDELSSSFGFGQDEIYRYLFSNYNQDDDLHKRPLSKLVRDISEELGLIDNISEKGK